MDAYIDACADGHGWTANGLTPISRLGFVLLMGLEWHLFFSFRLLLGGGKKKNWSPISHFHLFLLFSSLRHSREQVYFDSKAH